MKTVVLCLCLMGFSYACGLNGVIIEESVVIDDSMDKAMPQPDSTAAESLSLVSEDSLKTFREFPSTLQVPEHPQASKKVKDPNRM